MIVTVFLLCILSTLNQHEQIQARGLIRRGRPRATLAYHLKALVPCNTMIACGSISYRAVVAARVQRAFRHHIPQHSMVTLVYSAACLVFSLVRDLRDNCPQRKPA